MISWSRETILKLNRLIPGVHKYKEDFLSHVTPYFPPETYQNQCYCISLKYNQYLIRH